MKIDENLAFHTDVIDFGGGVPSTKNHENIKYLIFSKYFLKFEEKKQAKKYNLSEWGVVKTVWAEILHAKRYILDQHVQRFWG